MNYEKDILKWFNKENSDEELAYLKETKDFTTLEKIAHYSSQIDVPKINVEKAFEDFKLKKEKNIKKGKVVTFSFSRLYKYAAVIIVLLSTSYFLFFNNTTNYKTTFAQTKKFNLPDNSEVILNANSEISYAKNNWKENRSLDLNGEAYFKVEKGKKFTVNTTIGDVTVLGTQFNIKERKNYFEVKTYEGLVSVSYKNTTKKLAKGQLFKVVNGIIDTVNTFNINDKTWMQNESTFKSTPLSFVLEDITNLFDYKIETKNIDINKLYTGGFSHADIHIALKSVTIPLQLSYKIDGKTVTIYNYEN